VSNGSAIAAAAATLRQILRDNGIKVTLLPPDLAGKGTIADHGQVNLFLFQTSIDAAWRNQDLPGRVKPGEAARPPLPLNLHFLLTAYADAAAGDQEGLKRYDLLGKAMRIFADHPVLGRDEIQRATNIDVPGSDLQDQVERVRINPETPTTEEISKLWTAFQTPYRASAYYQLSVVLIESQRSIRAPLPVLSRGVDDRGPIVLTGSRPLLDAVQPVLRLPAVRLGDELSLTGEHLAGGTVAVVLRGPRGAGPFAPQSLPVVGDTEIVARLPDTPAARAAWPAGVYTAQVVTSHAGEPDRSSGELPFLLAPTVAITPPRTAAGPDVTLQLTVAPNVRPEQRVALLFGEREVPAPAHPASTSKLTFAVSGLRPGIYLVRLRADGVDSVPIDPTVKPPQFAADQTMVVT
jgi:hypothetical protein